MVLTVSFVLSPVTGLSCHRHPRKLSFANLTPASGRQDHTTSPSASARFVKRAFASTASRPTFVTIAKRPSEGRDWSVLSLRLPKREAKYFCRWGLDSPNQPEATAELSFSARWLRRYLAALPGRDGAPLAVACAAGVAAGGDGWHLLRSQACSANRAWPRTET